MIKRSLWNHYDVSDTKHRISEVSFLLPVTILMFLFMFAGPGFAGSPAVIEVGSFSAKQAGEPIPTSWKPLHFRNIKKHTRYELVGEDGNVAVKAFADGSASGLIREIRIDPRKYPIIQWRWKVMNILQNGDVSRKQGDDYPARIYIAFERDPAKMGLFEKAKYRALKLFYGRYPPHAALNYIWASKAPKGLLAPNPYTDRTVMIVARSGADRLGRWITEKRNLYEDYRKAFEEEPPIISWVAIMTDTDNTGEMATAYYGDIFFKMGVQ